MALLLSACSRTARVSVVDEAGAPISKASVVVQTRRARSRALLTNDQGIVVLPRVPGAVWIGVAKEGYMPVATPITGAWPSKVKLHPALPDPLSSSVG